MLLAAIFVMPLLLEVMSSTDYPELARLGKDSRGWSGWNSLVAVLLFTVGWLLTLPLWLIPGLALLLPMLWMAWLTRRTFAYDARCPCHATVDEWRLLRRQHGFPMLLLGVTLALLDTFRSWPADADAGGSGLCLTTAWRRCVGCDREPWSR
jgi:CysZ protein